MPVKAWIAGAVCGVLGLGCGAPAALLLGPPSPPGEALAWFPERSVAVAVIQTDPDDTGVARMLGALDRIAPRLMRQLPALDAFTPLLGKDLAVGVVAPGEAPLAVLVTGDGELLERLAAERLKAGRATPAGTYRGADLYAAARHAFAVRGDVLLVSRRTADLRRALDRRVTEDGLTADEMPKGDGELRARLDARAALARMHPRVRAVPWLAGARRVDVVVRAHAGYIAATVTLDTRGEDLVDLDVPIGDGRGPRIADVGGQWIAVRDVAHLFGVAERAAASAAPLALVRLAPAMPAARELASALHGPATLIRRGRKLLLRADPSRPGRMAKALDKLARALKRTGLQVHRRKGFYAIEELRVGVRHGVLVAGTARPKALERLARAPLARPAGIRGSLAFAVPRKGLIGWASATPRRTTLELRIDWP